MLSKTVQLLWQACIWQANTLYSLNSQESSLSPELIRTHFTVYTGTYSNTLYCLQRKIAHLLSIFKHTLQFTQESSSFPDLSQTHFTVFTEKWLISFLNSNTLSTLSTQENSSPLELFKHTLQSTQGSSPYPELSWTHFTIYTGK